MADLTSPAATDRILAVLAEALTTLGDIQHDRVIMAAAVLAHQQPYLTPSEVVDITATGLGDERARRAWAEGRRLLSDAADQAAAREEADRG